MVLNARGGCAPFTWRLLGSSNDFVLEPAGAEAHLSARALAAGRQQIVIELTDAARAVATRTLEVSIDPTPEIQTTSLPSVCPREVYSLDLQASGGDSEHYTWSTNLPATTGIAVVGSKLQGHFAGAAAGSTGVDVQLALFDGRCRARPVDVRLDFLPPTASACPEIAPESSIDASTLPPPCALNPYRAPLVVRRCPGPCSVSALALPAGITFDAENKILSGVASAPGTVTLQARSAGRVIETSYGFAPRNKCWFAYVSKENGGAQLHFFDALLGNRRDFPETGSKRQVQDFEFSPDGRFVAYRAAAPGEQAQLSLVKIETWQEQLLAFSGVTHYGWSKDSAMLALGYGSDDSAALSGVDVAHATDGLATTPGASPPIVFPTFDSVPTAMLSDPVWFGSSGPAFLTPLFGVLFAASTSSRTMTGFALPTTRYESFYTEAPILREAEGGIYVVPTTPGPMYYYPEDGSVATLHGDVIVSPSGNYTARARQSNLELFRAIDHSFPDGSPYTSIAGCDALIGWAATPERIACVYKAPNEDQVVIFDVTASGGLKLIGDVRGEFQYSGSAYYERRRLFSPKGKYFAFTEDDLLHVARVDDGTPVLDFNAKFASASVPPNNAFAELSFSKNERLLVHHRGARLSVYDLLDPDHHEALLSEDTAPSIKCSEDFHDISSGWCGVQRPTATFSISPNSDVAAALRASGELETYDLGFRPYTQIPVKPGCGQGCIVDREYAFQP